MNPLVLRRLDGRILFIPSWDRPTCELLVANLQGAGISAFLLDEDAGTIQRSLSHNGGQCIPLSAIAQSFIETVERRRIDPAAAAVWTFSSEVSCNAGMFAAYLKTHLEMVGRGFEHSHVYVGELSMVELSVKVAVNVYFAYMFGGYLRRLACRIRPYERRPGQTDAVFEQALGLLCATMREDGSKLEAVTEVVDRFRNIETIPGPRRPKAAIFGDLYSRDNEAMNQDLIAFIERHGGEAITTPYSEYLKIVAGSYFSRWLREGKLRELLVNRSLMSSVKLMERRYLRQFERILGPIAPPERAASASDILGRYWISERHAGESLDNILKIAHVLTTDPDVSLFVQANPAFCCPSLVTEGMAGRIEQLTGVPVVTVTYDGTAASKNDVIVPFLQYPRCGRRADGPLRCGRCA